jgi:hypothetical protein
MSKPFEIVITRVDNGWHVKTYTEALLCPRTDNKVYLEKVYLLSDLTDLL